jgi:hypothetical protein
MPIGTPANPTGALTSVAPITVSTRKKVRITSVSAAEANHTVLESAVHNHSPRIRESPHRTRLAHLSDREQACCGDDCTKNLRDPVPEQISRFHFLLINNPSVTAGLIWQPET